MSNLISKENVTSSVCCLYLNHPYESFCKTVAVAVFIYAYVCICLHLSANMCSLQYPPMHLCVYQSVSQQLVFTYCGSRLLLRLMKLWYALDLSCPPKWIDHSLGSISSSLVPPFSPLCRLLVHPPTSCLPLSCLRSLTREKAETLIRFRKQCLYLFNGLSVHEQTCQCLCSLLCM